MSDFVFAYHSGKMPESPEEGAKMKEEWLKWVDNLGDAAVDRGKPVGMSKTVSADGVEDNGGPNPISGIQIVKADSIEAALEMAKSCPHLAFGTIEVAEVMNM